MNSTALLFIITLLFIYRSPVYLPLFFYEQTVNRLNSFCNNRTGGLAYCAWLKNATQNRPKKPQFWEVAMPLKRLKRAFCQRKNP